MGVRLIGETGIFGSVLPDLPLRIPDGAKARLRLRNHDFARIRLRYADRIEDHYLREENGQIVPWILVGENRRPLKNS